MAAPALPFYNKGTKPEEDVYKRQADGLLGTLFAFVLLAHFTSRASRYRSVVVSAGCMVLALVKTSGMGLAFLAALVVLLDQLICERGLLKQVGRKSVIAGALLTTLPLISVAVVKISWDVHLRAMGAVGHWAENTINLSVIAELFSGTAPQYRYCLLYTSFLRKCMNQ